jgi:hypothetical protein
MIAGELRRKGKRMWLADRQAPGKRERSRLFAAAGLALVAASALLWTYCARGNIFAQSGSGGGSGTGPTIQITISDPTTCAYPYGPYSHIYLAVSDVQASTNALAPPGDTSFVDLTPQLKTAPVQVDLLAGASSGCFLAVLGSTTSMPPGSYAQIRLILAADAQAGSIGNNQCGAGVSNCVVSSSDGLTHALDIGNASAQGVEIPSGAIAGTAFTVVSGVNKDLNIEVDGCASVVLEASGVLRLQTVASAGEVPTDASSAITGLLTVNGGVPIAGVEGVVALERPDTQGVDRVVMEAAVDSTGAFVLCPVPPGTYDVVAVALDSNLDAYAPTVTTGVQPGASLGSIPMILPVGPGSSAGKITGSFTSSDPSGAGTAADVSLSALQTVTIAGASRMMTIPNLVPFNQNVSATIQMESAPGPGCPTGTDCSVTGPYIFSLPAATANVGAAGAYTGATTSPANYVVDARATVPGSYPLPDCGPSELMISTDANGNPLAVSAGASVQAATIGFAGCAAGH